ncbi:MAG: energy transducer TonB [Bacteroidales bacterium]|nr:energy transducer TonB [Bacteroidales bacterium]MBP5723732.1 energy transducer TonB [Bacteroidales bacterium]MBR4690973.1 energy transducer TonB [Bacteroidales bacterium]
MEIKKSEKANLEDKRFIFKEIGFVVVLLVVLGAFELGVSESNTAVSRGDVVAEDDVEMVEVTREEQPEPEPPKPELPEPPQSEDITEVEDPEEDQSAMMKANDDDVNKEVQPQDYGFGEEEEIEEKVHIRVEKMPGFPGGMGALIKFIGENLDYPQDAADLGVEGTVVVKFVVNKHGKAVNPEILKSVHPLLDKAALDVVAKLPTFEPGEQAGEKVPVYFNLPVQFKLGK